MSTSVIVVATAVPLDPALDELGDLMLRGDTTALIEYSDRVFAQPSMPLSLTLESFGMDKTYRELPDREFARYRQDPSAGLWAPWYKVAKLGAELFGVEISAKRGARFLAIEYISIKEQFRGRGVGRRVLTRMQQGCALNPGEWLGCVALKCFFPTFYLADTHYHWAEVHKLGSLTPPVDAPPRLTFPPSLHDPMDPANAAALYRYADLLNYGPLYWHLARLRYVLGNDRKKTAAFDWAVPFLHMERDRLVAVPPVLTRIAAPTPHTRGEVYVQSTAKLNDVLAPAVLTCIGEHCVKEGGLSAYVSLFYRLEAVEDVEAVDHEIRLVLAFLIDYCRIMFMPLVVMVPTTGVPIRHRAFFNALTAEPTGTSEVVWMPKPRPSFVRLQNSANGAAAVFLHVPVRKPHATSSYEGADVVPLPEHEDTPVCLMDLPDTAGDGGGGAKRARLESRVVDSPPDDLLSNRTCVTCRRQPSTLTNGVISFCGATCAEQYYSD
jgi:hypothetical protein